MKTIIQKFSGLLFGLLAVATLITLSPRSFASAAYADDVRAETVKYWADYAKYMKQATAEKDDGKAAAILVRMTKDLAPRGEAVKAKGQAWKKSHSSGDWVKFVKDMQDNTQFGEAMRLKSDPNFMMRMLKSPACQAAFGELTKVPVDVNTTL